MRKQERRLRAVKNTTKVSGESRAALSRRCVALQVFI